MCIRDSFATDASVLRTWATHVRTGEPIPERLVDALRDSAGDFVGFDTAQQLLYARVDLAFHGPQPPSADTTTAVRALHERAYGAALPWVDGGSCWHAAFSHLIGYSGGYYSYLWCRALAAQLWHERFADDPLSPSAGADLRRTILAPGNARPPARMLSDMLGGKALSNEALLGELVKPTLAHRGTGATAGRLHA